MNNDDDDDFSGSPGMPTAGTPLGHQLHAKWVAGGKKDEDLTPLMKHYEPFAERKTRAVAGGARMMNQTAVKYQVKAHMVDAFNSWDPNKGAALETHLHNSTRPLHRYVAKRQNVARIPEESTYLIGKTDRATAELRDELGRDPTEQEVAARLGVGARAVLRVRKQQLKDIPTGAFEVDAMGGNNQRFREIQPMVRETLKDEDKEVFDRLHRPEGPMAPRDIAKELGIKGYEVSRRKKRIEEAWKKHL